MRSQIDTIRQYFNLTHLIWTWIIAYHISFGMLYHLMRNKSESHSIQQKTGLKWFGSFSETPYLLVRNGSEKRLSQYLLLSGPSVHKKSHICSTNSLSSQISSELAWRMFTGYRMQVLEKYAKYASNYRGHGLSYFITPGRVQHLTFIWCRRQRIHTCRQFKAFSMYPTSSIYPAPTPSCK